MSSTRRAPAVTAPAPALALLLALALTLAGCGESGSGPEDTTDAAGATTSAPTAEDGTAAAPAPTSDDEDSATMDRPTPLPAPSDPFGSGELPLGPVPEAVTQRADVQDAVATEAKRSGVDVAQVGIAGYADVTWNDGSIGCPEPGQMYTQALVPGHHLVLEVDGTYLSYHAAQGQDFFYCASPVLPSAGTDDLR